ncbi:hypothetical protein SAY86_013069 [Trapa natans]|uniref:Homeobox domain-containing protein n=1 Tax=Trapa natans TaxID=22666 RepID=A0AAN7LY52_TRANT|nr:hypothetical protein SAY86_013069 [Trapa natans]
MAGASEREREREREEGIEEKNQGSSSWRGMEGSNIHPFYHGRSDFQIKRIKQFFGECPYPNHDQLLKLSKEIGLPQKIVRFWFQNHAAQMRQARTDDEKLRAMKEVLRAEKEMNKMLRAEKEMCKMLRS